MTSETIPERMRQVFEEATHKYIDTLQAKSADSDKGLSSENARKLRELNDTMIERVFERLAKKARVYELQTAMEEESNGSRLLPAAEHNERMDQDLQRRVEQLEALLRERKAEAAQRKKALLDRRVNESLPIERQSEQDIIRARQAATFNPDEPLPEADENLDPDSSSRLKDIHDQMKLAGEIIHDAEKAHLNVARVRAQQSRPLPPIEQQLRSSTNSADTHSAVVPGSMGGLDPNLVEAINFGESLTKRFRLAGQDM